MGFSKEAIVGLFTLAVGVVLFWATFYIGKLDVAFRGGASYSAVLESAHQLGIDSPIEVAGVMVGRITGVKIVRGGTKALIEFRLTEDISIYRDAEISVLTTGFLGDRYINLVPGSESAGLLPEDEPIVNTSVPIAMEEMMARMTPLIQDASALLQDMRGLLNREEIRDGIPETIDSLRHTALSLELVFADYEKYVSKLIRNAAKGSEVLADELPAVIADLRNKLSGDGSGGLGGITNTMNSSLKRFDSVSAELEQIAANLNGLLSDVREGKGAVGTLMHDEEVAMDIRESVESLNETLGSVRKLQTVVNYLGTVEPDFDQDNDFFRNTFELHLKPSYDHYYALGIVDRSGNNDLLFNAQIAKRFYDLNMRAGLIESEVGFGLDYAFWKDQFWLRSQVSDFGRNGDKPRVRAWAELRLLKHLTIAVGASDIAGNNGPRGMFGAGITFNDDDIRSLFGLARAGTSF